MYDMFEYENEFVREGYKNLAGIDEAGRGPLAGPVVCACVIMPLNHEKIIDGVNDSKKLSEKKRLELYDKITKTAICYNIVEIDNKTIDKINILNATKLAMANMSFVRALQIPVPSIKEQRRIVSILDHFDALCNDLTSGLPAEIEARKKQYEYYRDKLLSFKVKT